LFDINDFGDGAIYTNAAAPTRSEFCQATLTEQQDLATTAAIGGKTVHSSRGFSNPNALKA
jgi:hypothetical protein